ncbi:MAG: hypothetical protein GY783_19405 [Gammaproteobacteria bacterium]|nr:hypothetical protein [Gammaproteobacteria bacterium]
MSLKAHFHAKFAAAQQNYAAVQAPATSDDVAEEALGTAKQLVAESPTTAAKSLISFRAKVYETASYVRETVGAPDEVEDVDNAVAKVDDGLNTLEDEVASNRESSASVLAVDARTRQRSTIRIRTQEGDVVKLSLKRMDSLSATDVAAANGEMSATSTEVEVSSRSRMMLRVEGDLNESEFAAIQNVFAQAEQMADEFFGGDMGAAFNLAAGFEFDTEQLARVNMRFRMRQMTSVSYAESARSTPLESVSSPAVSAPDSTATPVIEAEPVSDTSETSAAPVTAPAELETTAKPVDTEVPENSPTDTSALASFFDALSAFLRSVGEGFSEEQGGGSFTYHYSESFKLSLLKAVIHTVAPEESDEASANASTLIDEVSE